MLATSLRRLRHTVGSPTSRLGQITKRFPGVLALDHVDFTFEPAKCMFSSAKTGPESRR